MVRKTRHSDKQVTMFGRKHTRNYHKVAGSGTKKETSTVSKMRRQFREIRKGRLFK